MKPMLLEIYKGYHIYWDICVIYWDICVERNKAYLMEKKIVHIPSTDTSNIKLIINAWEKPKEFQDKLEKLINET